MKISTRINNIFTDIKLFITNCSWVKLGWRARKTRIFVVPLKMSSYTHIILFLGLASAVFILFSYGDQG